MMNESQILETIKVIKEAIGVELKGCEDISEDRKGVMFWFSNYTRGNGPVFSIRPSGIKRHVISLKFGPYAGACIEHINQNSTEDSYALAYSFFKFLDEICDVKINEHPPIDNWKIQKGFNVDLTIKVTNQKSIEAINSSIKEVMVPLIAALSEVIGYEDVVESIVGDEEGEVALILTRKRERSKRNRLLCLSIHGETCGVCGLDPKLNYTGSTASIIEVHHIEPLSEVDKVKAYNPNTDLIPLCPNCHRAIHTRKPAYKPQELKALLIA